MDESFDFDLIHLGDPAFGPDNILLVIKLEKIRLFKKIYNFEKCKQIKKNILKKNVKFKKLRN